MMELTSNQRACLEAIIDTGGNMMAAASKVGKSGPAMTQTLRFVVELSGRPMPRVKGVTHAQAASEKVALCREILGWATPRPSAVESARPGLEASCHPDRPDFAKRLCRECYREQRERSLVSGAEIDAEREDRRERLIRSSIDRVRAASVSARTSLTPTERRVMEIMATGVTGKQAAYEMSISEQTIKNHLSSTYTKLGASTLVGAFTKLGWLRLPSREVVDAEGAVDALDEAMDDIARAFQLLGARS